MQTWSEEGMSYVVASVVPMRAVDAESERMGARAPSSGESFVTNPSSFPWPSFPSTSAPAEAEEGWDVMVVKWWLSVG